MTTPTGAGLTGNDGFSLLDTLIALIVAGLTATAATAAISFAVNARERMDTIARRIAFVTDIDRFLRSTTERLAISTIERAKPGFVGTSRSLTLLSTGPDALLVDHVVPMTIQIETDGPVSTLMLNDTEGASPRQELARMQSSLRFAFFGAPSRNEAEAWRDSWERDDAFPRALRMTISLGEDSSPIDLVYRLRPQPLALCLSDSCTMPPGL